jgi:hypothetical protein
MSRKKCYLIILDFLRQYNLAPNIEDLIEELTNANYSFMTLSKFTDCLIPFGINFHVSLRNDFFIVTTLYPLPGSTPTTTNHYFKVLFNNVDLYHVERYVGSVDYLIPCKSPARRPASEFDRRFIGGDGLPYFHSIKFEWSKMFVGIEGQNWCMHAMELCKALFSVFVVALTIKPFYVILVNTFYIKLPTEDLEFIIEFLRLAIFIYSTWLFLVGIQTYGLINPKNIVNIATVVTPSLLTMIEFYKNLQQNHSSSIIVYVFNLIRLLVVRLERSCYSMRDELRNEWLILKGYSFLTIFKILDLKWERVSQFYFHDDWFYTFFRGVWVKSINDSEVVDSMKFVKIGKQIDKLSELNYNDSYTVSVKHRFIQTKCLANDDSSSLNANGVPPNNAPVYVHAISLVELESNLVLKVISTKYCAEPIPDEDLDPIGNYIIG